MGKKRDGYPVDIIIQEKKSKLEELQNNLNFERADFAPKSLIIGSLKDIRPNQMLSIVGLVSGITPIKQVTIRTSNLSVSVRECQITDPSGSVKLTLWEDFVSQVEEGQTYKLVNVRLKSDNGHVSLSTTKNGCSITHAEPFPNLQPPQELPSTSITQEFDVIGISTIGSYLVCPNCSKKINFEKEKTTTKCAHCKIISNRKKAETNFYIKLLVKADTKKLTFTLFHNIIMKMVQIHNTSNNVTTNEQLTNDVIEEIISSFDKVTFTYNFTSNTITDVKA